MMVWNLKELSLFKEGLKAHSIQSYGWQIIAEAPNNILIHNLSHTTQVIGNLFFQFRCIKQVRANRDRKPTNMLRVTLQ